MADELISRQVLVDDFRHCGANKATIEAIVYRINLHTAVDAVEVVRCFECAIPHNKWTGCPKLGGLVTPPDFYCAYGCPNCGAKAVPKSPKGE